MGFAGDTFNTAWYARRLLGPGHRVGFVSAVGRDALSARMLDVIAGTGVETGSIARLPDRTVGAYLIELADGERSFTYWRDTSAARALADDPARLAAALDGAGVVLVSGITLAILPPAGRATLLAALAAARAAGTRIAFDSNIRPRLWPDASTMREAITAVAGVADIALPSFDDEAAAFGDANPAGVARRYAAAGASTVAVKNGAGPVTLLSDGGAPERLAAEPVAPVVDTTAAGDSFNAGFLAALMQGAPPADAARRAMALAARVVQARGALVPV